VASPASDPQEVIKRELQVALQSFDRLGVREIVDELSRKPGGYSAGFQEEVLGLLIGKRHFRPAQLAAEVFLESGSTSPKVRKYYVQALIDDGRIFPGISMAESIVSSQASNHAEVIEARGLLGRAYKQMYVNGLSRNQDTLEAAIGHYNSVYAERKEIWHGINVAALLARAERDQVKLEKYRGPSAAEIATSILQEVLAGGNEDKWAMATAAEAAVALGDHDKAVEYARAYAEDPNVDAFELASSLRQYLEVWQLSDAERPGDSLLSLLRGHLIAREGGAVSLPPAEIREAEKSPSELQDVFQTSGQTWETYRNGLERSLSIGKVQVGGASGTGFLIRGGDFVSSWGDEILFVTCAHLLTEDNLASARIHFEVANLGSKPSQMAFWSPVEQGNLAMIRLEKIPKKAKPCPIAKKPPTKEDLPRVYIVGHPKGEALSYLLHDNYVAHVDEKVIHYRAPGEQASPGSPVFDRDWNVVAVHHAEAGRPRLVHLGQAYEANEGSVLYSDSSGGETIMEFDILELPPRWVLGAQAAAWKVKHAHYKRPAANAAGAS
jgi:hypothetical protein